MVANAPKPPILTLTSPTKHIVEHVEACKTLTDDGLWHASKRGIEYDIVDSAHVAMLSGVMLAEQLAELRFNGDGVSVGVRFSDLSEALAAALKVDKKGAATLRFTEDSVDVVSSMGVTTIPCPMASELSRPRPPRFELPSVLLVETKPFSVALTEANRVSDWVALSSNGAFVVSAGDAEAGKVTFTIPSERVKHEGDAVSKFSLNYVRSIIKRVKADRLEIRLGTDYPLQASWSAMNGRQSVFIAPRIQPDE